MDDETDGRFLHVRRHESMMENTRIRLLPFPVDSLIYNLNVVVSLQFCCSSGSCALFFHPVSCVSSLQKTFITTYECFLYIPDAIPNCVRSRRSGRETNCRPENARGGAKKNIIRFPFVPYLQSRTNERTNEVYLCVCNKSRRSMCGVIKSRAVSLCAFSGDVGCLPITIGRVEWAGNGKNPYVYIHKGKQN